MTRNETQPAAALDLVEQARTNLERHAARTDLSPTLWADTCEILEHRLALALEVAARTPQEQTRHEIKIADRLAADARNRWRDAAARCQHLADRIGVVGSTAEEERILADLEREAQHWHGEAQRLEANLRRLRTAARVARYGASVPARPDEATLVNTSAADVASSARPVGA